MAHLTRQSDTPAAIAFLKQLDPDGYHALCAIHPDTRQVEGRVFKPGEWPAMADWIEARQGERNLYYSVNEPDPSAPFSKLKKAHIAKIRAVYADVDPKNEDGTPNSLVAERQRIRAMMDSLLSHPLHSPTAVVDSGGGMQAIWALAEKLPVADWANWAEALGRGIARKIGGDAVQNIERVMRLPGTVNLPDAGKRKKGRKSSIAELIEFNQEVHSPAHLEAFAPPISSADTTDQTPQIKLVADALDMDLIRDVCGYVELDADLRGRFDAHLASDEHLRRIWEGDTTALPGDDTTGSAFRAALARELRPRGYNPTEYGRLLWVWDHSTQEDRDTKLTRRTIARDWVRMGKTPADEEFEPAPIAQRTWPAPIVYEPRDPAAIPKRDWIADGLLATTFVTGVVAPGGVGKTTFVILMALALATGRQDMLGWTIKRRARVWYWNQEDDRDELSRRIEACRLHHKVGAHDLTMDGQPALFINSGSDKALTLAHRGERGHVVESPLVGEIIKRIVEANIEVFVFDPLVEFHEADENNNPEMKAVWAIARKIAVQAKCAVMVVAHTKKPPAASPEAYVGDIDSLRGASSQSGVMRVGVTLYGMSEADAKKMSVAMDQRHLYVRVDDGKANLHLRRPEARWMRRVSVALGNGEEVGALEPAKLKEKASNPDAINAVAKVMKEAGKVGEQLRLADVMALMTPEARADLGGERHMASEFVAGEHLTDWGIIIIEKKRGRAGSQFVLRENGNAGMPE